MRTRPLRPESPLGKARLAAAAAWDKKAQDVSLIMVEELAGYADYFLLASGRSTRQAAAIAENVARVLKKAGVKPLNLNGIREGRWALMDYGELVVHVFHHPVREFYDLESLWAEAPRVELDPGELAGLLRPAPGQGGA